MPPSINYLKVPLGVLLMANRLSKERYNGTPLREHASDLQRELFAQAEFFIALHKERNS